jgi:Domain of Unknown Function (DUF1080)
MRKYLTLALTFGALSLPGRAGADDWTSLLKDDLRHWQSAGGGDSLRAEKGTLTVDGPGQVVYVGDGKPLDLRDLELRAEVLTKPGGRAGLTFHIAPNPRSSGGVEVRLDNSYSSPGPGHGLLKTASLVWLRPVVKSVVPDDRWFNLRVTVRGPRVQVRVDKQLAMDYVEPEKLEAGPRLKRGTVAVRGHGGTGAVLIRKLEVRPLPPGPTPPSPAKADATDLRLARLREQGFLPVDYHTHLNGRLTLDDVLARSWQSGIGAGVAVPCGKGLAVADDKAAEKFLKSVEGRPVFVGMQAEGREWVRQFSPATVARFDYVFTDAMTLTDERGRRTRLWIKQEVDVPDPQAFMDRLVKTIETILDREPIDFYANPTYLPEVLAKDYDRLWTPERRRRVVDALARNGVALEINDTLRLPRPALIKKAKEAGVKFTFGTNNADRRFGRLEYCLRMVEECALTPDDLWAPKPNGQKPIQARKR